MSKHSRAIFLDRDGTINVDHGFVYRVQDWQFTEAAPEALKLLQDDGWLLILITNQSGIGHEFYTEADMHRLHAYMAAELKKFGVTLDGIAFCPHRRDGDCVCRKPKTGMLDQVSVLLASVDMSQSWMIGDKEVDVRFGQQVGTKTALLPSRYWQQDTLTVKPDLLPKSLYKFATSITKR